jgi:predicted permease
VSRRAIRKAFHLALRRPDALASDVDDEIGFHLQERIDALVARGWSRNDATAEATRRFGDLAVERPALLAAAQERERRLGAREWIDALWTDLRVAVRQLRRAPAFSFGAIAAFALGIGANATMFGVIDRLLLRPPPAVASPRDVYTIRIGTREAMPFATYAMLRDHLGRDAAIGVETPLPAALPIGRGDESRTAQATFVDGGYFRTLGVRPTLGRMLSDDDSRLPDGQPVAVIGYGLWQQRFDGDSSIIGRELRVSSERVRIVGVAPDGFNSIGSVALDLWLPLTMAPRLLSYAGPTIETTRGRWLLAVTRPTSGVDPRQVASRATALLRSAEAEHDGRDAPLAVELRSILPWRAEALSPEARVATLLGAVSVVVLLIACSNVANLMLARAVRRRREIAIRLALGVSRARLVSQSLIDSMLLATLGGVAAAAVAAAGCALMRGVLLEGLVWDGGLIDARTAAFIAAVVVFAGFVTGLVPAVSRTGRRAEVSRAIGEGRDAGGVHRHRVISSLVVTQTVLSSLLLIGATLFVISLRNVHDVPLGVDVEHTVVIALDSKAVARVGTGADELFAEVGRRVARAPGVTSVAVAEGIPFGGWVMQTRIGAPDVPPDTPAIEDGARIVAVTSGYFATIGTRILRGRAFTDADDRPAGEHIAIVSAGLADALWPAGDAVGRCIRLGADSMPCRRIVGVAQNARGAVVGADGSTFPYVYVPLGQGRHSMPARVVIARAAGAADVVVARLGPVVEGVGASVPHAEISTLRARLDPELRPWTLGATMFGAFGALALVLAALGLYSVIAYSVAQRRQEMGLRIALGAQPGHIVSLVGWQSAALAGLGVAIGVAGAVILAPLIQPLLFHVPARSAVVYAVIAGVMLVAALAASLLPASRAARLDPMLVIRTE